MYSVLAAAIATVAILVNTALAGSGAVVHVCVYFATKPMQPLTVQWDTCGSNTHCMYCSGKTATTTVTEAGVTCTNIGKVESKSSSSGGDTCNTDRSFWELSYRAGAYSGSAKSQWVGGGIWHNYIYLVEKSYSPGTGVCGTEALCPSTQSDWDAGTAPDEYFIFRPGYAGLATEDFRLLEADQVVIVNDHKEPDL
ncbi:hypothetical protein CcaCcLH18_04854 [Colletotrichum camelliae]|nr:hypothetical protein CcaCcLH18_04854 [Colletotrichum camelliae]